MKKKIIRIVIIVLVVLLCTVIFRSAYIYLDNLYPNKEFFGDKYNQIIYPTSISDYLIAKETLEQADKALSTITIPAVAEQKFGKLGRLCITDNDAVSSEHKLQFIAANFSDDEGYIWVKYTVTAYDGSGKVTFGSHDILARCELEKVDGEWVVTSLSEHP